MSGDADRIEQPVTGGSYVRQADGTLVRAELPADETRAGQPKPASTKNSKAKG